MAQVTDSLFAEFAARINAGQHINATINEEAQLLHAFQERKQLREYAGELYGVIKSAKESLDAHLFHDPTYEPPKDPKFQDDLDRAYLALRTALSKKCEVCPTAPVCVSAPECHGVRTAFADAVKALPADHRARRIEEQAMFVLDAWDDGQQQPETRCYVEGTFRESLEGLRVLLAAPEGNSQVNSEKP